MESSIIVIMNKNVLFTRKPKMNKKLFIILSIFLFSMISLFGEVSDADRYSQYEDIPKDFYSFVENAGKVVRYIYQVKSPKEDDTKIYRKSALVYVPYGFDENNPEEKYNVLYLMHGGGQSPEWYFTGEYSGSLLKSMLDRLHEDGKIKNLIVCAVSFNGGYSKGSGGNSSGFYKELRNELMPDFEEKFHIIKNREHRAYGGFSMGAMTTWNNFEHNLDLISFWIPISGDSWALGGNQNGFLSDQTSSYLEKLVQKQNMTKSDFKIYAGCGEHEIATPNLTPQIDAMRKYTETFIYTDDKFSKESEGNLHYILCKGSGHDIVTVLRTLYNALPQFFDCM